MIEIPSNHTARARSSTSGEKSMKRFVAISLCAVLFSTAIFASDNSYKVTYDGGSIPDMKAGTDMKLYFDASQIKLTKGKAEALKVPTMAITEISYGQDVHRRVGAAIGIGVVTFGLGALMALTKSKKHY